jgi:hypothetical protein
LLAALASLCCFYAASNILFESVTSEITNMPLVENARNLENNHHEGDKQESNLHGEAMNLLGPGLSESMKNNDTTQDMVKRGLLPHLDLDDKMNNSAKELKNDSCGGGELHKLNDFAAAQGQVPGEKGSGAGGGGGHHDSGSKIATPGFVAGQLAF